MTKGFSWAFLLASTLLGDPKSLKDLTSVTRNIYADLSTASINKTSSPTVRFSFVNPGSWNAPIEPSFDPSTEYDIFSNVANQFGPEKPLALYLPGLDCAGVSGTQQFDELSQKFELWRLSVTPDDRSSLGYLSDHVVKFINEISNATDRKVVLIGESFGGLLAPIVALKLKSKAKKEANEDPLAGMVLVNPATSFDESSWDLVGPTLASLRFLEPDGASQRGATPYTVLGGLALSLLVPDRTQLQQIVSLITNLQPQSLLSDPTSNLEAMNNAFASLGTRLPGELIEHRVKNWLIVGSALIKNRMQILDLPTLVVAGDEDNFLPSKKEAERLSSTLPNCETLVVRGSGHFVLDSRVNLTEAIIFSKIDPMRRTERIKYDPIKDWSLPDEEEVRKTIEERVNPLRQVTSPVFFSTDEDGKRWRGIGQVPSEGPIVFVGNHQFFGFDVGLIIAELIEQRGMSARGLAHPVVFPNATLKDPDRPMTPGLTTKETNSPVSPDLFRKFGAVYVSPRSYYKLLQSGQNVLLFPGGVREVFHGKDEAYKLFWPEKVDFVRMAARFNATIVPLSAVGAADSAKILLDAPELVKLPFGIGDRVREASANVQAARWAATDNEEELFTPPFAVPTIPARQYFVFGKPYSTKDIDSKDAESCAAVYNSIKAEIELGFDDILRAREHDPYKDSIQRFAFERATGKVAPTFKTELINKAG
eukprot:CAMPEP_0194067984 /NCGR_PEP_ID=MMETSP0009_2-20130614/86846_1 /TAXON_ID=210454 /ORGANISM="Grammatophora oceanica, Strain CCMP 410" /LENGTH=706 /DNA_ID=CAMNT_0038721039 /DNA_START=86 /DNA_END=2206 /DNA_ORIENTATION=+